MGCRLRSVSAATVSPAGHTAGMPNGGSGHADTNNSGPTWAASEAHLRDHAIRLSIGAGVIACAEVAKAKKPATAIHLIIVFLLCFLPSTEQYHGSAERRLDDACHSRRVDQGFIEHQ